MCTITLCVCGAHVGGNGPPGAGRCPAQEHRGKAWNHCEADAHQLFPLPTADGASIAAIRSQAIRSQPSTTARVSTVGLVVGQTVGLTVGLMVCEIIGLMVGLAVGGMVGLMVGLTANCWLDGSRTYRVLSPNSCCVGT